MPSTKGTKRNKASQFADALYIERADSDDEMIYRSNKFMDFNKMVIPGSDNNLLSSSQQTKPIL
jgi:hypothetical protein